MEKRGKFIVLEGIDGSGTTTQAAKLAEHLFKKEGVHVFLTKEPTGFQIGKEIKRRLKEDRQAGVDPFKEKGEEYANLYIEDRKFHVLNIILPKLREGIQVISDRHKYSTLAYQKAQGEKEEELIRRHEGLLVPDLVLILDVSPEEAMRRRQGDKTVPELFERLEFQKIVRENYLALKDKLPEERIVVIDGSGTKEEVHQRVVEDVEKLFKGE